MELEKDRSGVSRGPGASPPPSIADLDVLIPAYRFVAYLDSGGMGAVYKAVQKSLNRTVAVKLLPKMHLERDGFVERFKREAQALAQLNHPHIISVYDSGETADGQLYYVMEFVSGMDLHHLLKRDPPAPKKLLQILTQVCQALQYAHDHGVVHRDIKPANILLDEQGSVKVADFGLAKIIGPEIVDYTATGTTLGTPDYIAPEAMEYGVAIDHRVDIYSLGVMMYELLTGYLPKGQCEPPSVRSGADKRIDAVVSRAMQNDPGKRYQKISEMTQALEKLLKGSENWKNYRRSPRSGVMRVVPLGDAATGEVTQMMPQGGKPASRRPLPWAFSLTALAVVGGALAAWQGGWLAGTSLPAPSHPSAGPSVVAQTAADTTPQGEVILPPTVDTVAQAKLSHWIMEHGGFLNVLTPENIKDLKLSGDTPATWPPTMVPPGSAMKLIGGAKDLRHVSDLPKKGPFIVWRVSFLEAPIRTVTELEELVALVRAAGTVFNLNLHALDVPTEALTQLALMPSLISLDLTQSPAVTPDAIPHLAACKHLKLLLIGGEPSEVDELMFSDLQILLPYCGIHDPAQ